MKASLKQGEWLSKIRPKEYGVFILFAFAMGDS